MKEKNREKELLALEEYLHQLDHPLRKRIDSVRKLVSAVDPGLKERIKWNAPSWYMKEDLVTLNLRSRDFVLLVFHHPAVVQISSPLLEGDFSDRRLLYLRSDRELKAAAPEISRILQKLIGLASPEQIK